MTHDTLLKIKYSEEQVKLFRTMAIAQQNIAARLTQAAWQTILSQAESLIEQMRRSGPKSRLSSHASIPPGQLP